MKAEIHPEYFDANFLCSGCGASFVVGATIPEIRVNVCSACHPFFTGRTKLVDAEGRVDRFKKKYERFAKKP